MIAAPIQQQKIAKPKVNNKIVCVLINNYFIN